MIIYSALMLWFFVSWAFYDFSHFLFYFVLGSWILMAINAAVVALTLRDWYLWARGRL